MNKKYLFLISLIFPLTLSAQKIKGSVIDLKNEALIGAAVYWLNSSISVATDNNGEFSIVISENNSKKLVAMYVGYLSDTIEYTNQKFIEFKLKEIKTLNTVTITEEKDGIQLSNLSPIKIETITQTELKKSACCDLAGCFETQSSVQPQTTNVITNSKELRILGLSGVYNQVLIDGLPLIQGLHFPLRL